VCHRLTRSQQFLVLVCPSYAPYNGTNQSHCLRQRLRGAAYARSHVGELPDHRMPPGSWTAYPGFCAQSGCGFNAQAGVPVTLTAGRTTKANLTTSFLLPGQALLAGTVTVLNAPTGFSNPVGVERRCQPGTTTCQTFYVSSGTQFDFVAQGAVTTE